jgi:L-amino acid N-acyltransferase YncA
MGEIRVATAADAEAIAAIYAPYVQGSVISFEETPPSGPEMAGRIEATLPTHPFVVFEAAGGIVGYAYAGAHAPRAAYRWSCNVSVYVAEGAHRRGVGRALYAALFELLERQGFHSLFAGITLPNDKSVGLHEAMGFVHLGTYREVGFKFGAWHDVGYWRRGAADGAPAADPIPFSSLAG